MIEEVLPKLYKVEVPLPQSPLKLINSYVIKSAERNLIIDTGMNRDECKAAIYQALDKLEIDLEQTDFFVTHMHIDHSGLVSTLATSKSKIYASKFDGDILKFNEHWEEIIKFSAANGFPKSQVIEAVNSHPGKKFEPKRIPSYSEVTDGYSIEVGNYSFKCVWTPGHTRGHMCLYEPAQKIFVSGDHLLDEISPNITLSLPDQGNPLNDYLESLDKVNELDIAFVLPGHLNTFTNAKQRIAELKHHHELRFKEILVILEKDPGDAYSVASKMTWEIDCDTWEQFPVQQKWFAAGEALSHLRCLEEKGMIHKKKRNEIDVFSLN